MSSRVLGYHPMLKLMGMTHECQGTVCCNGGKAVVISDRSCVSSDINTRGWGVRCMENQGRVDGIQVCVYTFQTVIEFVASKSPSYGHVN
jgi:hypothetical protein